MLTPARRPDKRGRCFATGSRRRPARLSQHFLVSKPVDNGEKRCLLAFEVHVEGLMLAIWRDADLGEPTTKAGRSMVTNTEPAGRRLPVDLDDMTVEEFLDFVRRWAALPSPDRQAALDTRKRARSLH
jgi:hypothetical protein